MRSFCNFSADDQKPEVCEPLPMVDDAGVSMDPIDRLLSGDALKLATPKFPKLAMQGKARVPDDFKMIGAVTAVQAAFIQAVSSASLPDAWVF